MWRDHNDPRDDLRRRRAHAEKVQHKQFVRLKNHQTGRKHAPADFFGHSGANGRMLKILKKRMASRFRRPRLIFVVHVGVLLELTNPTAVYAGLQRALFAANFVAQASRLCYPLKKFRLAWKNCCSRVVIMMEATHRAAFSRAKRS